MSLIQSISGIRGTIGGNVGEGLSPVDIVKFTAAYGTWIKQQSETERPTIVIGRDARLSGEMVASLVTGTLMGLGFDIVDLGLSTTPTVEFAVAEEKAQGGIILTASHNPIQWNALKLLNAKGEFLSAQDGAEVLEIADNATFNFAEVRELGKVKIDNTYIQKHIDAVLNYPLVDLEAIQQANFKIAVDAVNSTGGISIVPLLEQLGVTKIVPIYCEPTGDFPHNPEPLPEHLNVISSEIQKLNLDLGIVVDPDVDRLAFVCEDGTPFGEEYTLVAVADYVLSQRKGDTVSNLSSTGALRDVTHKHGGTWHASAVGEVNVVEKMKAVNAVIGGEGNGGIIVPDFHYGRDALIGVGLFLSHLAHSKKSIGQLRKTYPEYHISKNKIELTPSIDVDKILKMMADKYANQPVNTIDGVKIEFGKEWVHLRKSNTEPIIRIYAESTAASTADNLAKKIISDIKEMINE